MVNSDSWNGMMIFNIVQLNKKWRKENIQYFEIYHKKKKKKKKVSDTCLKASDTCLTFKIFVNEQVLTQDSPGKGTLKCKLFVSNELVIWHSPRTTIRTSDANKPSVVSIVYNGLPFVRFNTCFTILNGGSAPLKTPVFIKKKKEKKEEKKKWIHVLVRYMI